MISVDIDRLRSNPNAKIGFYWGETNVSRLLDGVRSTESVEGFLTDDFSFGGSARYDSEGLLSSLQDVASNLLNNTTTFINTLMPDVMGISHIAQVQVRNINQTAARWSGTEKPSFMISMLLIATDEESAYQVMRDVKKMYKTVYPKSAGLALITAPLGYATEFKSTDKDIMCQGTVLVTVGDWFMAPSQVIKQVGVTYSQQKIKVSQNTYLPMYAKIDVTFEPYKALTIADVYNYFTIEIPGEEIP